MTDAASVLKKLVKVWREFNDMSTATERRVELRHQMNQTMLEADRLVSELELSPEESDRPVENSLINIKGNFYE